MREKIVHSATGITIIGAARSSVRQIARAVALAPTVVGADGGAARALAAGLSPHAVIGDLDSLSHRARAQFPPERLHLIAEQDSTDFEKCLYSIAAPFVLAIGVTGTRLDHSMAAMSILTRQTAQPVLILTASEVIFLCPRDLRLDVPRGTRLSLFPMAELRVTAAGVEWPLDHAILSPTGRIGTSNRTTEKTVTLQTSAPHLLVILPIKHLSAALKALLTPAIFQQLATLTASPPSDVSL